MNYYLTGIEGMPKLLDCCGGDAMQYFQKKKYEDSFQRFYQEHFQTLDAIEKGFNLVIDKEQFLTNMAEALVNHAQGKMEGVKGRSRRDQLQMELNLTMAVFVLPMILEFHGQSSEKFAEKLVAGWKEAFPKSNLKAADYRTIESGFHKKYCYITTAASRTLGMADDCEELNLLREYRDTYLANSEGGTELIERYYDVAPSIVKHIDQRPDACRLYQEIWDAWVLPCIAMIREERLAECRAHYMNMVNTLQQEYFRAE